mgnify:FL=1
MKYQKAKELLKMDISQMTLEELQKYKIKLLDAWRESRAEYGYRQAVENGYYKVISHDPADGFSPKDLWLTANLQNRYDEASGKENKLLELEG